MVGEYKRDINIIHNGIECIKKIEEKGRKWKVLSTPAKCACQEKRKRTIERNGFNTRTACTNAIRKLRCTEYKNERRKENECEMVASQPINTQ